MAQINFDSTLNINEVTDLIMDISDRLTVLVVSEPGVGKSSILVNIAERNGDAYRVAGDSKLPKCKNDKFDYIYVDCTSKELFDIAATIPNHADKSLEYYVSSLAHMDSSKPKYIMLDEFSKVPRAMKVIWTRMMLEKTWGDIPLPQGSRVFGTCNNAADGLGDTLAGHELNRVCMVEMQKPTTKMYLKWAANNGVHPVIQAAAQMYGGRWFASYRDGGQDDNPVIFNPKRKTQGPFLSLRSLTKCSYLVEKFANRENLLLPALAGTIGVSAAQDLITMVRMNNQIHTTKQIISDPRGIPLPKEDAAMFLMMFNALSDIETQDDLSSFMDFVERDTREEVQSVFFSMMFRSKSRIQLARGNSRLRDWSVKNYELIG